MTMTQDEEFQKPPRKIRNIKRGISRDTITQKHPLNVKPSGNALIFHDDALTEKRIKLKGNFCQFSDELLLDVLSFIDDPKDLLNLSHSSRIFYALLYDEELWRKLYIRKAIKEETDLGEKAPIYPLNIKSWKGSWRRTLLGLPRTKEAKIQLEDNLLCSDVLFRPNQCSRIDYQDLLKDLIAEEKESWLLGETLNTKFGIKRIDEEKMTNELFQTQYFDKPFIITNKDKNRWPSWTLKSLKERFPESRFRQESVRWPLDFYAQYFAENSDESPLYLFDCQSSAMKELVQEFQVPPIFQNDLFKVFNDANFNCRPDYRWIIVGPERSGSTFHKDPNHTSAWNANLTGSKLWVMLPPHIKPPGVGTDDEESEVTSPVGIAEWVLSGFYNDSVKLALQGDAQISITFPGEVMYVPSGWWHSVINLEDSVALTQNFVPSVTLPKVLNFFKNKNDQISGFHVKDFTKALQVFLERKDLKLDEENSKVFAEFLRKAGEIGNLDNEDIGEHCNYPSLPIYEFFIELLKHDSDYDEGHLTESLSSLKNLELQDLKKQNQVRNVVQSKIWDSLVQGTQDESVATTNAATFSFNFDEDDED